MLVVLNVFGALLVATGILSLFLRRRISTNLIAVRAGLDSRRAAAYSLTIGLLQLVLGVMFMIRGWSGSTDESYELWTSVKAVLGDQLIGWIALGIVAGVVGIALGLLLISRAWKKRETWGHGSGLVMPKADLRAVFCGTVSAALGAVVGVLGIVLAVGNASFG